MRLHYNFYMRESFFFSEHNKQIIFPSSLAVSAKRAQSFVVADLVCPKDITPDDIVDRLKGIYTRKHHSHAGLPVYVRCVQCYCLR